MKQVQQRTACGLARSRLNGSQRLTGAGTLRLMLPIDQEDESDPVLC